ncbi:LysR substrate-binding domain-containing protein [Duganella sp. Dugasp56]|uniref:LysR substrate-binding domain-containing protein n=1 Tax=Duganella sp. Dugasp56 TaxID=3243046 RepID=UPI0039AF202C
MAIHNTALREPLRWNFSFNEIERRSVSTSASIFLDTTLAVREAVREGGGVSVLPDYAIGDDLETGCLIHVLPQWRLPVGGIQVVFPSARFRPVKVRTFVEVLANVEKERSATKHPMSSRDAD